MNTLSAVIPATDSPPLLARCLHAITAAADPPDEVIVVDGPPELTVAAARNVGVLRATGDVVVFVDADVAVHADAFSRIRQAFVTEPDLTAVFGSYDDAPDAPGLVSSFRNLLHHHVHHQNAGAAQTFWTGLGAVRRRAFLDAGGFDEDRYLHPSIEDIELGRRLAGRGARMRLDPAIQGTHLKAWTLPSMLWTDLARRGIPWVALQVRERRVSAALNCGWRHRLSAASCVAAALSVAFGVPALVLAALAAMLLLNRSFYALLVRRQGLWRAGAGVVLHGLHYLVSVVAVPAGVVSVVAASAWPTPPTGATTPRYEDAVAP